MPGKPTGAGAGGGNATVTGHPKQIRYRRTIPYLGSLIAFSVALLLLAAALVWAMVLVWGAMGESEIALGPVRVDVAPSLGPWVFVVLAGMLGHTVASLNGAVKHGLSDRDFDPGAGWAYLARLPVAGVVVFALLATGDAVVSGIVGADSVTAPVLALAVTAGFFSEDTFHAVRDRFRKMLGRDGSGRPQWGGRSWLPDVPLDEVLDGVGLDPAVRQEVLGVLRERGVHGSRALAGLLQNEKRRQRFARGTGLMQSQAQALHDHLESTRIDVLHP